MDYRGWSLMIPKMINDDNGRISKSDWGWKSRKIWFFEWRLEGLGSTKVITYLTYLWKLWLQIAEPAGSCRSWMHAYYTLAFLNSSGLKLSSFSWALFFQDSRWLKAPSFNPSNFFSFLPRKEAMSCTDTDAKAAWVGIQNIRGNSDYHWKKAAKEEEPSWLCPPCSNRILILTSLIQNAETKRDHAAALQSQCALKVDKLKSFCWKRTKIWSDNTIHTRIDLWYEELRLGPNRCRRGYFGEQWNLAERMEVLSQAWEGCHFVGMDQGTCGDLLLFCGRDKWYSVTG